MSGNTKQSFFISVLIAFSLLFCVSCDMEVGNFARVTEDALQDGTLVMVYMAGANNLTKEIVWNINDMEYGLYEADKETRLNLHVVALCDQLNPDYDNLDGENSTWSGTRLYEIQPGAFYETSISSNIESTLIKTASSSLGTWRTSSEQEEDMGNIETLKNFIYWARETYPYCSKQVLILWDHGAGISSTYSYTDSLNTSVRNVCVDDETEGDTDSFGTTLYIDEIQQLLETIYSEDNKLELIGFDACYMGLYEVAYEFRNVAKYMAASPASETGGWAYDYIFAQSDTCSSGKNFAINVVDGYYTKYHEYKNYADNMTAFDLSYISSLKTEIDGLAGYLYEWITLGNVNIRAETIRDGIASDVVFMTAGATVSNLYKYYPYYELGSMLEYFEGASSSAQDFGTDVQNQVSAVKSAMQNVVMKAWLSENYGSKYDANLAYGMGIFCASTKYSYDSTYGFYTDSPYTEAGVLGYGGIDAANFGTVRGKTDTWREFVQYIYGGSTSGI
ncbi:MAG: clostripain-related cysteine peptidase [Treponemataceae bacterium]|nr:clostripain-related cysteine peptidase [Spirochaetales bacterium]MDY6030655.1 clostripain-related cysteine peptidase [Treponemataceae bacterium]